jgi:hypothetical protein
MKRLGYGQVEPNHLSAQRTGQIYAQLPATEAIKTLENGEFVKYDYANNEVNKTGAGEWMLVFNEVKLYENYQTYKDFAQKVTDSSDGKIYPRVFKTNVGDIYTTNMLEKASIDGKTEIDDLTDLDAGDILGINDNGYLEKDANSDIKFKVAKVYTMADGQEAVKIQRIA